MKTSSKNPLVKLISIYGQIAEHKSKKMQEFNMDEAEMLNALSIEEQDKLKELLTKLQTKWISDHKERMKRN